MICNSMCNECKYPTCIREERARAAQKRYYEKHKAERQAYQRAYWDAHKEERKKFYEEHREEINKYRRAYDRRKRQETRQRQNESAV